VVRSFLFVVAAASASWRELLRGDVGPVGWLLAGILLAGAVFGFASWFRTKFWIEADELRVDTGVVSRQSRRIRLDRLQGIDIVQPFVARLFGLAELRMDVAGGSAREGSLAFLRLRDARELRDVLLARRDEVRVPWQAAVSQDGSMVPAGQPVPDRVLLRLLPGRLILSILLTPSTLLLLVGLTALAGAFLATGRWWGLSGTLPVLAGVGVMQFRTFAANYNFTLSRNDRGLQVRRGLFDLSAQTIAVSRLQGVLVSEPALWRRLGWARLDVSLAGYSVTGDNQQEAPASTVLPVADRALAMAVARDMLGGTDADRIPLRPPPPRARWVAPLERRFLGVGVGEDATVSREGWLVRRTHVAPHTRVQSLRITQGPLQRWLGLADLHVDSPPGPVSVRARHRASSDARALLELERVRSRAARRPATQVRGVLTPSTELTTHQKSPSPPSAQSSVASPADPNRPR
jgi:putative membrane protein